MLTYQQFLLERYSIATGHYDERMAERLNMDNLTLKVKGIDNTDFLKRYFIDKVFENITALKANTYPRDENVKAIKTGELVILKEGKEINSYLNSSYANKSGDRKTINNVVFYSIVINNKLITIMPIKKEMDGEVLHAQILRHYKANHSHLGNVEVLDDELDSKITIRLDENNEIIERDNTNNIEKVATQLVVGKGKMLNHIGFIVDETKDKLTILKDENNKPLKDWKETEIESVLSLNGVEFKKNSNESVKDGIKILFKDKTQKTFKVGDSIKINDTIVKIKKIFLDKRTNNPVNFMFA